MKRLLQRFVREEQGQDLIEYAFLAAFIALVVLTAIQGLATAITNSYQNISGQLNS